MKNLPTEIAFNAGNIKVLLFHATPRKNNLYWYEDRPEKFFREMAEKVEANIMIYGHTHKPYWKVINVKIFINAGSVGKPKDRDTRACVTIVDISQEAVKVEFIRTPYEVEKVAAAIRVSGLPVYFAEKLKLGQ
jgi:putative phosphoesterase